MYHFSGFQTESRQSRPTSRNTRGAAPAHSYLALLTILALLAAPASAQVFRIETILGDFDPLETVPLAEARVRFPSALAIDSAGNLYFVDQDTYRVRKVDASGQVSTIAGSGLPGFSGDGGPATSARLGDRVEGLAVDGDGNIYIADTGNYRIRKVDRSGIISTVAGTGAFRTGGDGGPAKIAGLTAIGGLAVDAAGNLYVADTWDDRVRRIDANGIISTVAGTGDAGRSGDAGPAVEARLDRPEGVAIGPSGDIYIADTDNHLVRRVDASGTITTIVGTGDRGYSGDGGPATEAALSEPRAVAVDSVGNVYIADSANGIVRRVAADGSISTVAGIPPEADPSSVDFSANQSITRPYALIAGLSGELFIADAWGDSILRLDQDGQVEEHIGLGRPDLLHPAGVAIDANGNVFVADTGNHRVIKLDSSGVVTTLAGNGEIGDGGDGGPAGEAELAFPQDVALDNRGNVYIADSGNNRIRVVDPAGMMKNVAGTGERDYGGDGRPAEAARLAGPTAIAVEAGGAIYIADTYNYRIRKIDTAGVIETVAGNGLEGDIQTGLPATRTPLGLVRDIAVDSMGWIYFPDEGLEGRVLAVDPSGTIKVAAGGGERGSGANGGPAVGAWLRYPSGVAISGSDTLYIAESFNNAIRRVSPDGIISTIAGSGEHGYDGDGFPATKFRLNFPGRLAAVTDETLVVLDDGNQRVRLLTAEPPEPVISSILNGASYTDSLAPGTVGVIEGVDLASGTEAFKRLPESVPLPTALLETSVTVTDRTPTSWARRKAGLYSVAPTEIRFLMPERAANGLVIVTVEREGKASKRRGIHLGKVAPALFSANGDGRGVAAASAVRVARNGTETSLEVVRYDSALRRYVATPIDLRSSRDPVYLTFFGTGMRGRDEPASVTIGGERVDVHSLEPASGFSGVDELVVGPIPRSISGEDLEVGAVVDGLASNGVTISIRGVAR